ncbi:MULTISPECIES: AfsR/SARP family transcriptional regulator [unclassified Saccharothrix]|uniref:AfsR/SARP family transcriptional regulator n=1 Tax=unclassified Saccharothrix TaxID=2593673 RepID=UPI00307CFF2A
MQFGVLGPLSVTVFHRSVELRGVKQRALLAVLLCRAGTPVSTDRLIDALWGSKPPRTAPENLRLYLSQLRRALGDRQRIVRRPPGYALLVRPGEVDADRFDALVERGRAAGDPQTGSDLLRQALALWRGDPYADVADLPVLREEADRLRERRQLALEARAEADLALGRHGGLVAELSRSVAEHPLRERLRGQLMLALYRAGRQADALQVYRDTRHLLAAELGLEPGAALQRLERAILNADPALDLPGPTTAETRTAGRGRDQSPVPRQLPPDVPHFVGRQRELAALSALVEPGATAAVALVDGTAGVGKTALVTHWAHRVAPHFPDGQLHVDLRGFSLSSRPTRPEDALHDLLQALRVPADRVPAGLDARVGLYRSLLADRRVLLFLDNARDTEQVRPLLPGSRGPLVLITSRTRLTGLLAREAGKLVALGALGTEEALALATARLGSDRVDTDPRAAHELVERCARLPLALVIAIARAATRPEASLRSLLDELTADGGLDAFDAGEPDVNLRNVFSWSYHALTPPAARLFRLLSQVPGADIGTDAAASLAGTTPAAVRPVLAELARAHLVDTPAPNRLRLHDLLRAYAAERLALDAPHECDAALRRLLDHYLHTALAAQRHLLRHRTSPHADPVPTDVTVTPVEDQRQASGWFLAEHHNVVAASDRAAVLGLHTHASRLPQALAAFLKRGGHWHTWIRTQRTALAAAEHLGDRQAQARAHRDLARGLAVLGNPVEAEIHLERALLAHSEAGEPLALAGTLLTAGWVCVDQHRYGEAADHARRALDIYRAEGHRAGEGPALNQLGWARTHLDDTDSAIAHFHRSLEIYRELDHGVGIARVLDSLGRAHHLAGHHVEAVEHYHQALALQQTLALGDRFDEACTLNGLGDTHAALGDHGAARDCWTRAVTLFDELGHTEAEMVRTKLSQAGPE